MQIPANVTLQAWRNATWTEVFELADGAVPLNLTGWDFDLQVRDQPGQTGTALLNLGLGSGLTSAGADLLAGVLNLSVAESTMNGITGNADPAEPRVLWYDLKAPSPGGVVSLFLEGQLLLWNGVTR